MELILINVKTDTMSSGEIIFLDNQNLLNYPNITISDTGATYNLTEWHVGMINMKISGAEDIITAENREKKRPTKIGDLPVTLINMKIVCKEYTIIAINKEEKRPKK